MLALDAQIVLTAGRFVAAEPDDDRVDLGAVEIEDDVATTKHGQS
jgi:Xaa-Pro aminopeptidase